MKETDFGGERKELLGWARFLGAELDPGQLSKNSQVLLSYLQIAVKNILLRSDYLKLKNRHNIPNSNINMLEERFFKLYSGNKWYSKMIGIRKQIGIPDNIPNHSVIFKN